MNKIIASIFISLILLFSLTLLRVSARVISEKEGITTIDSKEVINDDLFITGKVVEINGTINGDVYTGGETVRVNGNINGDIFVGAGDVNLSGFVRDDVYIGAGNVTIIGSKIGDSLLIVAGNVQVDSETTVGGSLLAGSGTIRIQAPIERNVYVGAGSVELNSRVGGEARFGAGSLYLGPNAKIEHDLFYSLGENNNDISIAQTATVAGMINRFEHPEFQNRVLRVHKQSFLSALRAVHFAFDIMSFIGALIVGSVLLLIFPTQVERISKLVATKFLKSVGIGFLFTILTFPVIFSLLLTIVLIPLTGLLTMIVLIHVYLAKIVAGIALGKWLQSKFNWDKLSFYLVFTIGLFSLYVLKQIPFFGFILYIVAVWSGFGAFVLYYKENLKKIK